MSTISTNFVKQTAPNCFYLSLVEFLMHAKQHIVALGDEFGLTSIQAITLLLIDEQHPRPMKRLGQMYNCDASNVTGIIDGLEKKRLVSRRNDPKDRRIKIVCLEAAGKRLQQKLIERLDDTHGVLFSPLNELEKQQFTHIVEKIAATKKPA